MEPSRPGPRLVLRFHLVPDEALVDASYGEDLGLSVDDLTRFVTWVQRVARRVSEREALELLASAGVAPTQRIGALRGRRSRHDPFSPTRLTAVEDGSVVLVVVLTAHLLLLWVLKNMVGPALLQGWEGSVAHEKLVSASQNVFGGAARTVEQEALKPPGGGQIEPRSVERVAVETAPDSVTLDIVVVKDTTTDRRALEQGDDFGYD
jgi:hypothetical protein